MSYTTLEGILNSYDFVGYDNLKKLTQAAFIPKNEGYPSYNIVKDDDTHYRIELAVAGFSVEDITIVHEDTKLVIKGSTKKEESSGEYIHKGIAGRSFIRTFHLADSVVVKGADLKNGILAVNLENVIPEHKKPRKIFINDDRKSDPKLLIE
jgi:molecular chaperone IbpA